MNILCLNTSFSETYVAVKTNQNVSVKSMDSSLKQSENVLGAVDECLSKTNITPKNLDVISCVIGPGSFTGIRIGASLVKGICMACPNIKKIAINSLDLLAFEYIQTYAPNDDFNVVLNGLSGNIFMCKYNKDGKELLPSCMLFGDEINTLKGDIVGLKEENLDICNKFVEFDCNNLLKFTLQKIDAQEYSADFVPLYLRKSQAEAELDKKNGNS